MLICIRICVYTYIHTRICIYMYIYIYIYIYICMLRYVHVNMHSFSFKGSKISRCIYSSVHIFIYAVYLHTGVFVLYIYMHIHMVPPPKIHTVSVPISHTLPGVSNLPPPCAESAVNTSANGFSVEQLLWSSHVDKLSTSNILHTRIWLRKAIARRSN